MDILTRGRKRFEIVSLDEELDYLRAEVHYFDDEDTAQPEPEIRKQVLRHFRLLKKLGSAQGRGEPDLADPQLSFQLAQMLPDLDFLSTLAAAVGSFPAQTTQPIPGGLHSAAARHRARAGGRADQRVRRQTQGAVG
jgi:hypothetical protein